MRRPLTIIGATFLVIMMALPASADAPPILEIDQPTTLTEDHVGQIEIIASNVILDCAGYSVIASGEEGEWNAGILASGLENVTIQNCRVDGGDTNPGDEVFEGFTYGILVDSVGSTIRWNTATNNEHSGISVGDFGNNNNVSENSAFGNLFGFVVSGDDNTFTNNTAYKNVDGFVIHQADNNVFHGNEAERNTEFGFAFHESSGNTMTGNTANHNAVFGFWVPSGSEANLFEENEACHNKMSDAEFEDAANVLINNVFCDQVDHGGVGELNPAFHAGPNLGTQPEGRLVPWLDDRTVCDQLVVGTWAAIPDSDREWLDTVTTEFKLDSHVLETVRTPNSRIPSGGDWWFAEGVPVLGLLEPGLHEIELTIWIDNIWDSTYSMLVDVDAAYC